MPVRLRSIALLLLPMSTALAAQSIPQPTSTVHRSNTGHELYRRAGHRLRNTRGSGPT